MNKIKSFKRINFLAAMNNRKRCSDLLSSKTGKKVVSKLSPQRSPSNLRISPSRAEIEARLYSQDISFRSPIIADLQAAYAKALNSLDMLKAEKTQMKVDSASISH